jgi:hypothetical protein
MESARRMRRNLVDNKTALLWKFELLLEARFMWWPVVVTFICGRLICGRALCMRALGRRNSLPVTLFPLIQTAAHINLFFRLFGKRQLLFSACKLDAMKLDKLARAPFLQLSYNLWPFWRLRFRSDLLWPSRSLSRRSCTGMQIVFPRGSLCRVLCVCLGAMDFGASQTDFSSFERPWSSCASLPFFD